MHRKSRYLGLVCKRSCHKRRSSLRQKLGGRNAKDAQKILYISGKKWNFIVLDSTQFNEKGGYIAKIDEEQFLWLKNTLQSIPQDNNICIVSHIPILSVCSGLFWDKTEVNGDRLFKRNLMHTDFIQLKELFLQHPNVKVCISGHIHMQDEIDYLGVKYYCNGAVSGNWWKGKFHEFPPAYALIELHEDGSSNRVMHEY